MSNITVEEFLAWAKTKPADEEYDYIDNKNCAFGQFLQSKGYTKVSVVPYCWDSAEIQDQPIPDIIQLSLNGGGEWDETFGNLVEELERRMIAE